MRTKPEILGFRDEQLSRWHRQIGYHFPAFDLDFFLVEYTHGLPAALIEYKMVSALKLNREHPTFNALRLLADNAKVPAFVVRYTQNITPFIVSPVNHIARNYCAPNTRHEEHEYITLLAKLRQDSLLRFGKKAEALKYAA